MLLAGKPGYGLQGRAVRRHARRQRISAHQALLLQNDFIPRVRGPMGGEALQEDPLGRDESIEQLSQDLGAGFGKFLRNDHDMVDRVDACRGMPRLCQPSRVRETAGPTWSDFRLSRLSTPSTSFAASMPMRLLVAGARSQDGGSRHSGTCEPSNVTQVTRSRSTPYSALQDAPAPDGPGLRVGANPDTPALQVLRGRNSGVATHPDRAVVEHAHHRNRQGYDRLGVEFRRDESGEGHLRYVERLFLEHPAEGRVHRRDLDELELDAGNRHPAVLQRPRAAIGAESRPELAGSCHRPLPRSGLPGSGGRLADP